MGTRACNTSSKMCWLAMCIFHKLSACDWESIHAFISPDITHICANILLTLLHKKCSETHRVLRVCLFIRAWDRISKLRCSHIYFAGVQLNAKVLANLTWFTTCLCSWIVCFLWCFCLHTPSALLLWESCHFACVHKLCKPLQLASPPSTIQHGTCRLTVSRSDYTKYLERAFAL